MTNKILVTVFLICSTLCVAQNSLPEWFMKTFEERNLNKKYDLVSFIEPEILEGDFDGDSLNDIATLIVEKNSNLKGILVINQKSNFICVINSNSTICLKNPQDFHDASWITNWKIYNDDKITEIKVKNNEIKSSKEKDVKHKSILISEEEFGIPLFKKLLFWDGKQYSWIFVNI